MKDNIYKELFTLVSKDGERLVIIDPETDDGIVVMRLSEFRKITNDTKEITVEKIEEQATVNEPILAKNETQNLSFWEHTQGEKVIETEKLDNSVISGRIHERKSTTASKEEEFELVKEDGPVEESAGEEYYFEPAEEIGL